MILKLDRRFILFYLDILVAPMPVSADNTKVNTQVAIFGRVTTHS